MEIEEGMINHQVDTREAHPEHPLAVLDLETGHANIAVSEVIQETGTGRGADQKKDDEVVQEIDVEVVVLESVQETEIEEGLQIDILNHLGGHQKEMHENLQEHLKFQLNAKSCSKNGERIIARPLSKLLKSLWSWLMKKSKYLGYDHHLLTFIIDA